jgi:hypothetical protein
MGLTLRDGAFSRLLRVRKLNPGFMPAIHVLDHSKIVDCPVKPGNDKK